MAADDVTIDNAAAIDSSPAAIRARIGRLHHELIALEMAVQAGGGAWAEPAMRRAVPRVLMNTSEAADRLRNVLTWLEGAPLTRPNVDKWLAPAWPPNFGAIHAIAACTNGSVAVTWERPRVIMLRDLKSEEDITQREIVASALMIRVNL